MEVEREKEWKATEEEEAAVAAAAEELGGLQTRQTKGKMGRKFEEKVASGEDSEEQHSLYLDADKGGDVENGTVEAKESSGHNDVPVEESNGSVRNVVVENESYSHHSSDKKSGNGFTRIDNEIQDQAELTPGESSTFVVEEFDVERVLREQETHDLICPKCRSCITKRVILRKRKRTLSQSGLPPPKAQNVSGASPLPTEPHEPDDTTTLGCLDTAVFRCLSCFSFFIPTETGCNILRVFWKRPASDDTQSSENKPARTGNWVTSCFGSDSSQNDDTEAEVPLLQETRDPSMGPEENSPPMSTPGTVNHGENAGSSTGVSNSNGGIMGNQAQGDDQKNSAITVSEDPSMGASNSNGVMGNLAVGDKQKNPATTVSEGNATEKPGFIVKPPSLGGVPQINGNTNYSAPPVTGFLPGNATEKPGFIVKPPSLGGVPQINGNINYPAPLVTGFLPGNNIGSSVGLVKPTRPVESINRNPNIDGSEIPATGDAILDVGMRVPEESPRDNDWDVLKSIVYGGLIESITSLGVVSSAAGTGSSTLNICALGLANLIGGLFVIAHDISELRSAHDTEAANQSDEQAGRYWEKLGQRKHFQRHTFFAILSYVIFGLLPPVVYGFAFRVSDNKEYKLIAVAVTSLLCVALLAIGKAHVRPQKDYIFSLFYYLGIAVPASGLSYVAGVMIDRLLVELGLFNASTVSPSPPASTDLLKFGSGGSAWASI